MEFQRIFVRGVKKDGIVVVESQRLFGADKDTGFRYISRFTLYGLICFENRYRPFSLESLMSPFFDIVQNPGSLRLESD